MRPLEIWRRVSAWYRESQLVLYGLVVVALLPLAVIEVHRTLRNPTPTSVTLAQVSTGDHDHDWVHVTGTRVDLGEALLVDGGTGLDSILVPVRSAEAADEAVALLWLTSRSRLVEPVRARRAAARAGREDAWLAEHVESLRVDVDARGLLDPPDALERHLWVRFASLGVPVAERCRVLRGGARRSLTGGVVVVLGLLVIIAVGARPALRWLVGRVVPES